MIIFSLAFLFLLIAIFAGVGSSRLFRHTSAGDSEANANPSKPGAPAGHSGSSKSGTSGSYQA